MAILRRNATLWPKKGNPAVSAAGFRSKTLRFYRSGIRPGTLVGNFSRQFRFNFCGRCCFKAPLALVLARARDLRRWSDFHKEPPLKSLSWRTERMAHGDLEVSRSGLHRILGPPLRRSSLSNTADSKRVTVLLPVCVPNIERLYGKAVNLKMRNSGQGASLPLSLLPGGFLRGGDAESGFNTIMAPI